MARINVSDNTYNALQALKNSSTSPMAFNWAEFTEVWVFDIPKKLRKVALNQQLKVDSSLKASLEGSEKGAQKLSSALLGQDSARSILLNILFLGRPFVAGGDFKGALNKWALRKTFGLNARVVDPLFEEYSAEIDKYNAAVQAQEIADEL